MTRTLSLLLATAVLFPLALLAHPGGLDKDGCHKGPDGPRHCHGGAKAEERRREFTGRAVRVLDGDTIEVLDGGKAVRIRLQGVDCPEKAQAFGSAARKFTGDMVAGKEVRVAVVDTDRYGRTVAEVFVGGRSLNRELVRAGMAWWYRQYAPKDQELESLETEAKRAKRGLWADRLPIEPWLFRQRKTKGVKGPRV